MQLTVIILILTIKMPIIMLVQKHITVPHTSLVTFNQLHEMYIYTNIEITNTMLWLFGAIYSNLDMSSKSLTKHFKYIESTWVTKGR